jgi:regulatory protein
VLEEEEKREEKRLIELAIRKLGYREHSKQELVNYLERRANDKSTDKVVETVIARLVEMDLVNDERFTQMFIRSRLRKHKGRELVKRELRQKGVEEDIIHQQINNVSAAEWQESALTLLQIKYSRFKDLNGYAKKAKMKQILYMRGFSTSEINATIDDLLSVEVK